MTSTTTSREGPNAGSLWRGLNFFVSDWNLEERKFLHPERSGKVLEAYAAAAKIHFDKGDWFKCQALLGAGLLLSTHQGQNDLAIDIDAENDAQRVTPAWDHSANGAVLAMRLNRAICFFNLGADFDLFALADLLPLCDRNVREGDFRAYELIVLVLERLGWHELAAERASHYGLKHQDGAGLRIRDNAADSKVGLL